MKAYIRQYSFAVILAVAFFATIIAYGSFSRTEHFQTLLYWSGNNFFWLCLILIVIKIIGIIWPPLPGLVFTVGAIPIFGWFPAFMVDMIGAFTGSCLVFWVSRIYGQTVILKVFGKSGLHQVQRLKFNPANELEAIIIMRVFGGPISELVSYGAGLTNISFRHFLMGTMFSYLLIGLPLFYLAGIAFSNGGLLFGLIPLCIGITIMYTLRKRYFIFDD
jgi:uncharacterized membrane protein YdjX (TVP38/TMEM64 family)